jgi:hypothetical protein
MDEKPKKRLYATAKERLVAANMLEVLKETGKINMTEVHRRVSPNTADESHNANGYQLLTEDVLEVFFKLIRVDDKSIANLGVGDVIGSILSDLKKLDLMMESPTIGAEDLARLANVKTAKQRLLGAYLGIFKEDRKNEVPESNPDELFKGFKSE